MRTHIFEFPYSQFKCSRKFPAYYSDAAAECIVARNEIYMIDEKVFFSWLVINSNQ